MLCVLTASEDLINTTYEVFPEAAANDAFILACAYNVDLKGIKWLYNKAPEAIKRKSPWNKLPLHAVMELGTCLCTVKFLHQSYPAAFYCVRMKMAAHHFSMHFAIAPLLPLSSFWWEGARRTQSKWKTMARRLHFTLPFSTINTRRSLSSWRPTTQTFEEAKIERWSVAAACCMS